MFLVSVGRAHITHLEAERVGRPGLIALRFAVEPTHRWCQGVVATAFGGNDVLVAATKHHAGVCLEDLIAERVDGIAAPPLWPG